MKVIRADHLGMCFGVRDAIALAEAQTQPITILGDLVHNESVLAKLRSQGVKIEHQVAAISTPTVMITAHGASERTIGRVRQEGFTVIQATCPLVHHAHRAVARLVQDGFHPVIVGQRGHVEVRGIVEDLDAYDVVLDEEDVMQLQERARFGIAAQTTQPIERVRHLAERIQARFPGAEVRVVDTVCQPTKQRQSAAIELAQRCEVVIVIGGAHSNNTRELAATCREHCPRVYHVQSASDLRSIWFDGRETVGVTAGTSTPDNLIDEVEQWLNAFAEFQTQLGHALECSAAAS